MTLIKTESFQLATYSRGEPNSAKLALVLPGFLDTKDYAHMKSHVDFLASKGYFALSFDPQGTWESPGDIKLYTMTNYLKAINELINYYGNKPTFVMGHSRGASMSIQAGISNPFVTVFAAIMPVFISGKNPEISKKQEEWKRRGYKVLMRDLPPGGGEEIKRFELPYSFFEDQLNFDMTEGLKGSIKPKLFLFGKKDTLVTHERVKEIFNLASEPKELHELNSDHDYRLNNKLIEEVNEIIGEFIKKIYQS